MKDPQNICALDYLIGTLATAYKGSLQSLICKDFCINQTVNGLTFSGRILSSLCPPARSRPASSRAAGRLTGLL
jgi:hypothetical protein